MTSIRKLIITITILCTFANSIYARRYSFEGFPKEVCIDPPEGFRIEDSSGTNSFQLTNIYFPVQAIIQIKNGKEYENAETALKTTAAKLKLNGEISSFLWNSKIAALSIFDGNINGKKSNGYSMACPIDDKGNTIILIAWTDNPVEMASSMQFIASFIDSLYIDSRSYFIPGPVTAFAFPENSKKKHITVEIDGKKIDTEIRHDDAEAQRFVVEREYDILYKYNNAAEWKEAWQRHYRMIFRDSAGRLLKASYDIGESLAPDCADETELAQKLLTWTQNMNYTRRVSRTDFTTPAEILEGTGSDCDGRSMIIAVIMQSLGYNCIMYISSEFSHAIGGLESNHPGFGFETEGKKYLTGETTAKGLTWGKINSTQTDYSKWIPVLLP